MKKEKYQLLRQGILYDLVGFGLSFIPGIGDLIDLVWAPYAAKKMNQMYPGRSGSIASVIVFIEEILPVTDIIPTFTLMWLYTFVWKSQKEEQPQIIEINE